MSHDLSALKNLLKLGHGLTAQQLLHRQTEDCEIYEYGVHLPLQSSLTEGHFPGMPILPGITQLMVLLILPIQSLWMDFTQIKQFHSIKFLRALLPGDSLKIYLERAVNQPLIRFRIFNQNKLCTRGSVEFYDCKNP